MSAAIRALLVVGLSHKTAPVEVREKFSAAGELLPAALARLAADPHLAESMMLSTCNRVEILATAMGDIHEAARAVRAVFAEQAGVSPHEISEFLYEKSGEEAVLHLFRVAASLDSMVLGEPQILGQVKDAHDAASAAGTLGHLLGRAVGRAFSVAKRVRTDTQIGAGTVSISSVAVDLAKRIFGDLKDHGVLLVGAGEMAEAAAKSLGKSAKTIRVCNRSFEKAASLAATFGGGAAPLEALEDELLLSDVVVASTGSRSFVITKELVKRAMKARKGRTLFLIDIAVPRNIEPDVHKIDNVYVYNIDDLEHVVAEAMRSRKSEVAAAEQIVAEELRQFVDWARGLDVQPTVVALRARTKAILQTELERSLSGRLKHLGEGDRAVLMQMMESAVAKLMHAPTTRLKASAAGDEAADHVRSLRVLFDLPDLPPVGRSKPPPRPTESAPAANEDDEDAEAAGGGSLRH